MSAAHSRCFYADRVQLYVHQRLVLFIDPNPLYVSDYLYALGDFTKNGMLAI